jgi:hypothetical protein
MLIKTLFVYLIIIWQGIVICAVYNELINFNVLNTYELPSTAPIGRLTSEKWSFNMVREGLLIIFWMLAPWSIVYMFWSSHKVGWYVHIIFSFIILIWGLCTFIFDLIDINYGQVAPWDANFERTNFARDLRWCCLYGGQAGTSDLCSNSIPCSGGGIFANSLATNFPFVLRFSCNLLLSSLLTLIIYISFKIG